MAVDGCTRSEAAHQSNTGDDDDNKKKHRNTNRRVMEIFGKAYRE